MKLIEITEGLTVYRGSKVPETSFGDSAKMDAIFASTKRDVAAGYGKNIAEYEADDDAKILDYDLDERGSDAEKFVKKFLTDAGKTTPEKFERDPRAAMAMLFMIPTKDFVTALGAAGYDAAHMHTKATSADELIIVNPAKFKPK